MFILRTTTSVPNSKSKTRVFGKTADNEESTQENEILSNQPTIESVGSEEFQELFSPGSSIIFLEFQDLLSPGLAKKTKLQSNLTQALFSFHKYIDFKSVNKNEIDSMFMKSVVQNMQLIKSTKDKIKFNREVLK